MQRTTDCGVLSPGRYNYNKTANLRLKEHPRRRDRKTGRAKDAMRF